MLLQTVPGFDEIVDVDIAYGTDLDQSVTVLREAMNGLDNVLVDPPAVIGVAFTRNRRYSSMCRTGVLRWQPMRSWRVTR